MQDQARFQLVRGLYVRNYKLLYERYKKAGRKDFDGHARNVAEHLVIKKFGKELAKQARENYHGT